MSQTDATPDVPTDVQIIAWFAGMSRVNQLAAAMNPSDWAKAQTRVAPDQREEFERRAHIWSAYMLKVIAEADAPETPEPKFYRTRISFDVLSEEPIPPDTDIAAIARECDEGSYVMAPEEFDTDTLTGAEMAQALFDAGSDPSFFQLDDEGNRIEEE